MTYSYNPADIASESISRARFELGDVLVDGGADTCFLSDEEIQAVINDSPRWTKAMYRLADAVCMRLSYETNWKNDGTSFDLSQRAERWIKLRDKLQLDAEIESMVPDAGAVNDSMESSDGGHYFHRGMQKSPYVVPPYPDYVEGDP